MTVAIVHAQYANLLAALPHRDKGPSPVLLSAADTTGWASGVHRVAL
jgi:hypothetical protein